jgi:hypothetical protein
MPMGLTFIPHARRRGSMYYVYITLRPDRIRSILANTRNNVAMTILRFESDEIIEVLVKSNMPFPFVETT